jgi:hypothetical protein
VTPSSASRGTNSGTTSSLRTSSSASSSRHWPRCVESPDQTYIPEPGRATIDVFNVFAISLDVERYRIVQQFIHGFLPLCGSFHRKALPNSVAGFSDGMMIDLVRGCFTSKVHAYALLTTACTYMKIHLEYRFEKPGTLERYMDASVFLLRQYLSQSKPVTDHLIMTIFSLSATEAWLGNYQGAWVHIQAIRGLCETHLGGFRNLNPALRGMIMFPARLCATLVGRPYVCEKVTNAEPFDEEQSLMEMLTKICNTTLRTGSGFHSYVLGSALLGPITEVTSISRASQFILCGYKTVYPKQHDQLLKLEQVRDRLVSLSSNSTASMNLLQDCIRLALVIWSAYSVVLLTVPSEIRYEEARMIMRPAVRSLHSRLSTLLFSSHPESHKDFSNRELQCCPVSRGASGYHNRRDRNCGRDSAESHITNAKPICRVPHQCQIADIEIEDASNASDSSVAETSGVGTNPKSGDLGGMRNPSSQHYKLCAWVLALGVFASEVKEEQAWFRNCFKQVISALGINSWISFAKLAQQYLWLDHIERAQGLLISELFATSTKYGSSQT